MQVKFASAASGFTNGGEASIGVAAWAVAMSTSERAAKVTTGQIARFAVPLASFHSDKQNKKQVAARLSGHAQPARPHRLVPRGTPRRRLSPPASNALGRARAGMAEHFRRVCCPQRRPHSKSEQQSLRAACVPARRRRPRSLHGGVASVCRQAHRPRADTRTQTSRSMAKTASAR